MGDDDEEVIKYVNAPSQVLNSLKELQRREEYFFMKNSKKKFIELEKQLQDKNTYFGKTKIPEIYEDDLNKQRRLDLERIRNPGNNNTNYCQKCPVFKNYCPHKNVRPQIKEKYSYPLTTSSGYGWMPEFDRFKDNFRTNQVTKDFYSSHHLS